MGMPKLDRLKEHFQPVSSLGIQPQEKSRLDPCRLFMAFPLSILVTLGYILCSLTNARAAVPTDIQPNLVYYNTQNTTEGSAFKQNLNTVLGFLYKETPLNGSATYGYGNYPDIAYGFSECYNMSQGDCGQCFNSARDDLDRTAPLAVGAQIWINNTNYRCYLRFENYNFVSGYVVPNASPPPTTASISPSPEKGSSLKTGAIVGITLATIAVCSALFVGAFCLLSKRRKPPHLDEQRILRQHVELEGSIEGPLVFRFEDLRVATRDFSQENKLGRGGFGEVFKAVLKDGTEVAVKKLSLQSHQGKQEFVNEISIISGVRHRNLVRLNGYCVEGDERLLVLEFLENGSLDRALFNESLVLDWPTRYSIAIGIARGLAYLHEESQIQIIHRDIKASNILLDGKLHPKISDFGISKLFDQDKGFTSTKVAGTLGYLAPEYAMRGRLTVKADVFSFGVLVLEIVGGRKCNDPTLPADQELLLEWTWSLYGSGKLEELIDKRLSSNYSEAEAFRAIHIAILCTDENAENRPIMSDAVAMLLGYLDLPPPPTQAPRYFGNMKFDSTSTGSSNTRTASDQSTSSSSAFLSRNSITDIGPR